MSENTPINPAGDWQEGDDPNQHYSYFGGSQFPMHVPNPDETAPEEDKLAAAMVNAFMRVQRKRDRNQPRPTDEQLQRTLPGSTSFGGGLLSPWGRQITINFAPNARLLDCYAHNKYIYVSRRLKQFFEQCLSDGEVEFIKCTVGNEDLQDAEYYLMHIIKRIDCIDRDKAEYTHSQRQKMSRPDLQAVGLSKHYPGIVSSITKPIIKDFDFTNINITRVHHTLFPVLLHNAIAKKAVNHFSGVQISKPPRSVSLF